MAVIRVVMAKLIRVLTMTKKYLIMIGKLLTMTINLWTMIIKYLIMITNLMIIIQNNVEKMEIPVLISKTQTKTYRYPPFPTGQYATWGWRF